MACDDNDPGWCQPATTKPQVTFFRRLLAKLAIIPYCGIWYRKILGRLRQLICLISCVGEVYGDEVTVTDSLTLLRFTDRLARKTFLVNKGSYKAKIFESGALIRILYPGNSMESPLQGRLEYKAICPVGQSTVIAITTEQRCDCDIELSYYYYGTTEPIGGPLI